jgi:hypothetical protein
MLIQHLDALGRDGSDTTIEVSLIEVRFDKVISKNNKIEVGYDIIAKAIGDNRMFHAVDKIDVSNYLPTGRKAREAILTEPQPKCFRGIPVNKGKTQTSSLVKLLALLYRSAWYKSTVDQGLLDPEDADRRISSLPGGVEAPLAFVKNLVAENKKAEAGAQLPVVGRTPAGLVVLGLKDISHLTGVDHQTSIDFTKQILSGVVRTEEEFETAIEVVDFEIQTKRGRARNLYGKEQAIDKLVSFSHAEAARVYGLYDPIDVRSVKDQYGKLACYPVKIGENPEKTNLYFISLQAEHAELVKATVEQARQALTLARAKKKKKDEDSVDYKAPLLPVLKRRVKAKVILGNLEGTQKTFLLLNQVFPSVPLYYWQILNEELPTTQWKLIQFNKTYRSGPLATPSPSSYVLWTKVFTRALNREQFDPYLVWHHWGAFLKNMSNQEITGSAERWSQALLPVQLVSNLTYLNNLISVAQQEDNLVLEADEIRSKAQNMKQSPTKQQTEELVGAIWNEIFEWQQELTHKIHTDVVGGIPEKEFPFYLKGVAVGILLNSLVWQFGKKGVERRFDYSNGMHLTNLRGRNLTARFKQAQNLYRGLNKAQQGLVIFPFSVMSHIDGMTEISKKQAFNDGLITGIVSRSYRSLGSKEAATTELETSNA